MNKKKPLQQQKTLFSFDLFKKTDYYIASKQSL